MTYTVPPSTFAMARRARARAEAVAADVEAYLRQVREKEFYGEEAGSNPAARTQRATSASGSPSLRRDRDRVSQDWSRNAHRPSPPHSIDAGNSPEPSSTATPDGLASPNPIAPRFSGVNNDSA